jgi:uncharacterized membrane-anchored protein
MEWRIFFTKTNLAQSEEKEPYQQVEKNSLNYSIVLIYFCEDFLFNQITFEKWNSRSEAERTIYTNIKKKQFKRNPRCQNRKKKKMFYCFLNVLKKEQQFLTRLSFLSTNISTTAEGNILKEENIFTVTCDYFRLF